MSFKPRSNKPSKVTSLAAWRRKVEAKKTEQAKSDEDLVEEFNPKILPKPIRKMLDIINIKKRSASLQKLMLKIPSWISPNGVTIFRAFLVIPAVLLILAKSYWLALGVLMVGFILDAVDGALAEARGQQSKMGAFLDPLADKILICGSLLALSTNFDSYFFLLVIFVCTVASLLTIARVVRMSLNTKKVKKKSIAATSAGKWKFICQVCAVTSLTLSLALGSGTLMGIGVATLCFAVFLAFISLVTQVVP